MNAKDIKKIKKSEVYHFVCKNLHTFNGFLLSLSGERMVLYNLELIVVIDINLKYTIPQFEVYLIYRGLRPYSVSLLDMIFGYETLVCHSFCFLSREWYKVRRRMELSNVKNKYVVYHYMRLLKNLVDDYNQITSNMTWNYIK